MTRSTAVLLALLVAAPLPVLAATSASYGTVAIKTSAKARVAKTVTLPDGLRYTDLKVGRGKTPQPGQTAVVHYTGTFPDGKTFDSSRGKAPFTFVLGAHQVIPCWDEGVATMRVGGRRKLTCPPALAYGDRGAGGVIPPNATLNFDVELLAVR
ncbi:MAG TPA: FKBP-type peptidyl-prolyl cis-trans isomerase [Candidatus Elarobacter sp.]|jgi:peptidylprolyl isomerase|nr:FKBP-type peptidyl-prolyl cis-trans isomerase [Candidatus Elarobacter sp.]